MHVMTHTLHSHIFLYVYKPSLLYNNSLVYFLYTITSNTKIILFFCIYLSKISRLKISQN